MDSSSYQRGYLNQDGSIKPVVPRRNNINNNVITQADISYTSPTQRKPPTAQPDVPALPVHYSPIPNTIPIQKVPPRNNSYLDTSMDDENDEDEIKTAGRQTSRLPSQISLRSPMPRSSNHMSRSSGSVGSESSGETDLLSSSRNRISGRKNDQGFKNRNTDNNFKEPSRRLREQDTRQQDSQQLMTMIQSLQDSVSVMSNRITKLEKIVEDINNEKIQDILFTLQHLHNQSRRFWAKVLPNDKNCVDIYKTLPEEEQQLEDDEYGNESLSKENTRFTVKSNTWLCCNYPPKYAMDDDKEAFYWIKVLSINSNTCQFYDYWIKIYDVKNQRRLVGNYQLSPPIIYDAESNNEDNEDKK